MACWISSDSLRLWSASFPRRDTSGAVASVSYVVAFGRSPHRRRDERSHPRVWLGSPLRDALTMPVCPTKLLIAHRNIELTCPSLPVTPQRAASKIAVLPHPRSANRRPQRFREDQREVVVRVYLLFFPQPLCFFSLTPRLGREHGHFVCFRPPLLRFPSQSILPSSLTVTRARWGGIGRSRSNRPLPSCQRNALASVHRTGAAATPSNRAGRARMALQWVSGRHRLD